MGAWLVATPMRSHGMLMRERRGKERRGEREERRGEERGERCSRKREKEKKRKRIVAVSKIH